VSDSGQLDFNLLQDYLDNLGKDIVQQMLDLYVQQSELYLVNIQENSPVANQDAWQEACHKMKGAAGSVGLLMVHQSLASIEKSTAVANEKMVYVQELISLNNKATSDFKQWLQDI